MLTREDIQRQITVVAVIAMKESSLLLPVDRIVGGIEVQNDFFRRRFIGCDECIDHPAVNLVGIHRNFLVSFLRPHFGTGQLQPIQRALARQRLSPVAGLPPVASQRNRPYRWPRRASDRCVVGRDRSGLHIPDTGHTPVAQSIPSPCARSIAGPDDRRNIRQVPRPVRFVFRLPSTAGHPRRM